MNETYLQILKIFSKYFFLTTFYSLLKIWHIMSPKKTKIMFSKRCLDIKSKLIREVFWVPKNNGKQHNELGFLYSLLFFRSQKILARPLYTKDFIKISSK